MTKPYEWTTLFDPAEESGWLRGMRFAAIIQNHPLQPLYNQARDRFESDQRLIKTSARNMKLTAALIIYCLLCAFWVALTNAWGLTLLILSIAALAGSLNNEANTRNKARRRLHEYKQIINGIEQEVLDGR